MLRRTLLRRDPVFNGNQRFKTADWHQGQRTKGHFSAESDAEKLGIHPRFAQGLLMKADLSFKTSGRGYPASFGRSSRPNAKSCTKRAMFPFYYPEKDVKFALDRSKRRITTR